MTAQSRRWTRPGWPGIFALIAATLLVVGSARAEVALLVQGYFGNGNQWRLSGVVGELGNAGWSDAGHLRVDGGGVYTSGPQSGGGPRHLYTVALPTASSFERQLPVLERYVDFVRDRHGGESLFLLAHSAGGVLARLYMVENPQTPVAALITVASPHLGTEVAEVASLLSEGLDATIGHYLGALGLTDSYALYRELAPERPGNFLYRLNRREHPATRYVSVVRRGPRGWAGDLLVAKRSQDMNAVLALRGRATVVFYGQRHALQPDDGRMLARILERLQST